MADGIPHPAKGGNVASITYNDFFMPNGDFVYESFTLLAGTAYKRGTVLGQITASGKLTTSLSAAGDGSQVPMAILGEDVDCTAGDINFKVLVHGKFNPEALIFGTGQTEVNTKAAMRDAGLYYEHPF